RQHAVVLEEDEQIASGILQRLAWRGRPDRCDQWRHEMVDEVSGEAMPVEERAERLVAAWVACQQPGGGRVEPFDLGQHPEVARAGQRRPGGEKAAEATGTRVLHAAG